MILRMLVLSLALVVVAAGCGKDERGDRGSRAVKKLRAFYAAADASDGRRACTLLSDSGIRQIVRVRTRAACVATINGFAKGGFHSSDGEFVHVDRVEDEGGELKVEAEIEGRTGGTFTFDDEGGTLLITGFRSEEG